MKITTVTGINRPIYSNSIERALKKDRNANGANGTRSFNQALALYLTLYLCALWLCPPRYTPIFLDRWISFLFDEIFMKLKINNNMRSGPMAMPLTPYLPL